MLAGYFGGDFIEAELRNLPVIASTTLLFGLLLGVADKFSRGTVINAELSSEIKIGLKIALIIGLAQALAPVPGVSRSGITMTAALLLGLSHQSAAKFSLLLSIPVIFGAGLLSVIKLCANEVAIDWMLLAFAAGVSAVTAYACIAAFIGLLDRVGFMPFVYYRVALAVLLFIIWWF
jgi:undecaprenyl-diphosphatase